MGAITFGFFAYIGAALASLFITVGIPLFVLFSVFAGVVIYSAVRVAIKEARGG